MIESIKHISGNTAVVAANVLNRKFTVATLNRYLFTQIKIVNLRVMNGVTS